MLDNGTHCLYISGGARRARSDGYIPDYACGPDLNSYVLGDASEQRSDQPVKSAVDCHIRATKLSDPKAIGDYCLVRGQMSDSSQVSTNHRRLPNRCLEKDHM